MKFASVLFSLGLLASEALAEVPVYLWLEAEEFSPLKGGNFSYQHEPKTTPQTWSLAGPGVAPEWTMGGESEWMSIAARSDVTNEVKVSRSVEVPVAGQYRLLVRYADYRGKKEEFGVRLRQGGRSIEHIFGQEPRVDELEPMKMLWGWSFAWDETPASLARGSLEVEIFTTGPTEARRAVDCVCLTTDENYHPHGRDKPDFGPWRVLRSLREQKLNLGVSRWITPPSRFEIPVEWKLSSAPPAFLWNVDQNWEAELQKDRDRIDDPFGVDPPLTQEFLAAFRIKRPPVYSDPLSGPVLSITRYPSALTNDSPFLQWLQRHPERSFAFLLNYAEPVWSKDANRPAIRQNLRQVESQFAGFIAGENISYASPDETGSQTKIRAATTRHQVFEALREMQDAATIAKFSNYFGAPVSSAEAWGSVISCLSANMEAYCHLLCGLGVRRIGHENTGNSPTLARRLAFLRGAARQFGAQFVNYQSCNLGDSATMFSRQNYLYPGSSRYILDNQYDTWAGAGHHWLLKDYLLWHIAGVSAFYNEQGIDIFWKPGGNSAGDDFPVQLSPKGQSAEAVQKLAHEHPRGTQYTPVAFLLDEAHGWSQERFQPGAFGLDPELNPAVLRPGSHEASIRGWFDLAYFPAPETQNEPASAIRQTFVNGMFGDIFDVVVTAPGRTNIVNTYGAVIVAGEVALTEDWGQALKDYIARGGTLVLCAGQLSGVGAARLNLPRMGTARDASAFTWGSAGPLISCQPFRFYPLPSGQGQVLARVDGEPLAIVQTVGRGRIVIIGVPMGLGSDQRPISVLGFVLQQLVENLMPITVSGDVEWTLNRAENGNWIISLFNNQGYLKPQHGILPTDQSKFVEVMIQSRVGVVEAREWITARPVPWTRRQRDSVARLTIPAAAVRFVEAAW